MIELSIVTGTYNRLKHLQKFVYSVRMSVGGLRFPYEIVLVDGGSKDGTIEWCLDQPDVVLIEQGKLLGAVKAFNAGASAARGRYVILANDDVEFVWESILNAYAFIVQNPTVGIGCFYQNRNDKDWHVEYMSATKDGKPVSVPYGQVCILPKELGDKVGWWGDQTHTYGGDNELSCNVLQLGLEVKPVECSCINDLKVDDNLRKINKGDPQYLAKQGKPHPDSIKWAMKWRQPNGITGPIIPSKLMRLPLQVKPRVLYAPIHEPGNELQRKTKTGLYAAMVDAGWVVCEHDYMTYGLDHLQDVADAFKPDMFLLQLQDAAAFPLKTVAELKRNHPSAIFVSWNGDYHPEKLLDKQYMKCMKLMDVATFVTADIEAEYVRNGINFMYWQIGFETSKALPNSKTPKHDVLFMGNCYSPKRVELVKALASMRANGVDVGLYGQMPDGLANGSTLYNFDLGHRLLKSAKIVISDQQWPHATGYVSNRFTQSLYAGAFVLQQQFDGMNFTKFDPGLHFAVWDSIQTLPETCRNWLQSNQDSERVRIAKAGHEQCLKVASFSARLQELINELGRIASHNPVANLLCDTAKRTMA